MTTNVMQTQLHGVFLVIEHYGVLLTGKPGVGKSSAALGLIDRGHQLIADDLVEFVAQDKQLIGRCPPLLCNLLKIRGIELLDISKLYDSAICYQHSLDLIIDLKDFSEDNASELDTIEGNYSSRTILDKLIPQITITSRTSLDIALLIELLVKNQQLKVNDQSASESFHLHNTLRLAACA